MADMDDGCKQTPLPLEQVEAVVAGMLSEHRYDLMLTHGPQGEYTRHRRHEECCHAVVALWRSNRVETKQMAMFAYEDGGGTFLPRVRADADWKETLTTRIWLEKRRLITGLYGYEPKSWEAQCTPRIEGFWHFNSAESAFERTKIRDQQS